MYGGSVILDTSSVTARNKTSGMIQTATFTMTTAMHPTTTPSATAISFVHEPIESFQNKTIPSSPITMSHRRNDSSGSSQSQQALREPEPPPSTSNNDDQSTITMFLSMEMCCARTSDEVTKLWGYHPRDLVHRSLYELISSHDTDRLGRLHRLLLDNIMDMTQRHDNNNNNTLGPESRPPLSERTTSPIFYDTDPDRLMVIASGSGTFSDTLHFKKQDGEHELYEVIVYLGGGLGANLTKPSTLEHLYVVAEMKKHQYRIEQRLLTHHHHTRSFNASSMRFKQTLPRVHASTPQHTFHTGYSSSSSSMGHTTLRPIAPQLARPSSSGPLQARQGSLPGHFAANSQLNTVSLPASKKDHAVPKVNIAPISNHERHSNHGVTSKKQAATATVPVTERLFPSFTGGPYFRRIAAASPNGSAPPPIGRESNNPYSTLAYRFAPAAPPAGSPRGGPPSYTHPATQYFLQTSSSTLNAAASAAQSSSTNISTATTTASHPNTSAGGNTMAADNDKAVGKTDSKRKAEMSIRSLLC